MAQIKEETEQFYELPQNDLKIISQHTTKYCFTQTSPSSPPFDFQSCIPSSTDISFEHSMHLENIQTLRVAADRYLQECLSGQYDKKLGLKDSSLFKVKTLEPKAENQLENIIVQNQLLNQEMRKEFLSVIEKEQGLIGLLKELPKEFGITVAKQIVYVTYHILQQKYKDFKELIDKKQPIIPKMPCFQECDEEFICQLATTSCPVYEDISVEEVVAFAEKQISSCANETYFGDIVILNLKQITCECKKNVDILEKFSRFVSQIARVIFLSIVGATEQPQGIFGLDLSREISLAELSQGGLSNQRSFSRALVQYQDEESYDFISKKIKFD